MMKKKKEKEKRNSERSLISEMKKKSKTDGMLDEKGIVHENTIECLMSTELCRPQKEKNLVSEKKVLPI